MPTVRWFAGFLFWNVAAFLVFMTPHEIMRGDHVDGFMRPLLILSFIAWLVLHRALARNRPANTGHLLPWIRGFHFILWGESVMEAVIFTLLDFHETPANDPFFMAFWVVMAAWAIGGWAWIERRSRNRA